jgi:hypothetical protein
MKNRQTDVSSLGYKQTEKEPESEEIVYVFTKRSENNFLPNRKQSECYARWHVKRWKMSAWDERLTSPSPKTLDNSRFLMLFNGDYSIPVLFKKQGISWDS